MSWAAVVAVAPGVLAVISLQHATHWSHVLLASMVIGVCAQKVVDVWKS